MDAEGGDLLARSTVAFRVYPQHYPQRTSGLRRTLVVSAMALDRPANDGELNIDLIAASLRADSTDVNTFVEALAVKLEDAVPGATKVYRWRGKLLGPKRVGKITVDAGGQRLELKRAAAGIETSCSRVSGGIVLRTEPVDIESWLTALGQALAEEAQRSQTTRQALERLLNE